MENWIGLKAARWQAPLVARLIRLVRAAAPAGRVSIKWAQPVLEQHGPVAYVKLAKAHVSLGFWRDAE